MRWAQGPAGEPYGGALTGAPNGVVETGSGCENECVFATPPNACFPYGERCPFATTEL